MFQRFVERTKIVVREIRVVLLVWESFAVEEARDSGVHDQRGFCEVAWSMEQYGALGSMA